MPSIVNPQRETSQEHFVDEHGGSKLGKVPIALYLVSLVT